MAKFDDILTNFKFFNQVTLTINQNTEKNHYQTFIFIFSFFSFQSAKHEEALSTELQALKDQVNLKRSSMNEQISHLESLREEVKLRFLSIGTVIRVLGLRAIFKREIL